jgi:hypothetical protein
MSHNSARVHGLLQGQLYYLLNAFIQTYFRNSCFSSSDNYSRVVNLLPLIICSVIPTEVVNYAHICIYPFNVGIRCINSARPLL